MSNDKSPRASGGAASTFHQLPWRHNCAQAVAFAHGDADMVAAMAHCGGGRAPEGMCGALYAAMLCCPDRAEQLRKEFALATGGHLTCADIKRQAHIACERCVQLADALVSETRE